jgi:multiple sugar transport system ATP-binding protein
MNMRTVNLVEGGASLGGVTIPIPRGPATAAAGLSRVTIGLRPETFTRSTSSSALAIRVTLVEELGADAFAYGTLAGEDASLGVKPFVVRLDARSGVTMGDTILVEPRSGAVHLFHPETGERLG